MFTFYELCLREIRESQALIESTITSGAIQNFEEYKHITGILEGLKKSEFIVKDIYKKIFESKDIGDNQHGREREDFEFY